MFEERNNPILNTNIILYDKQRNMNGLEPVFFNTLLKNRKQRAGGGVERKLEETMFITFMKALKQLCSAVSLYGNVFVCGRQLLQSGLNSMKANGNPFQRPARTLLLQ